MNFHKLINAGNIVLVLLTVSAATAFSIALHSFGHRAGYDGPPPLTSSQTDLQQAPAASSPSGPVRALFFGDSLISGTGTIPGSPNMSTLTGEDLDWDTTVNGFGGTGFGGPGSLPGGMKYLDRLHQLGNDPQFDVIVLEGGTNDKDAPAVKERAWVTDCLHYLKAIQPQARVVLMGPYEAFGKKPTPADIRTRDAIADVASAEGDAFVDFLAWTPQASRDLRWTDGFHPNSHGYAYLAQHLETALRAIELPQSS